MYKDGKKIISICTAATLALTSSIVATKVSAADLPENTRLWGTDRYETAVKISQNGWKSGAEYAILASGEGYADALCAAPLAKAKDAPILLTKKNSLNKDTLKELKRLGVKQVYIIGGNGSVSKEVENKVKSIAKNTERLQGKDRYETSVKIAEKLGKNNKVILASGEGYADALSAAPVAAIKGIPVVLTRVKELPQSSKEYIKSTGVTQTYVIGGTASVSDSVKNSVPRSKRVYGKDRFETNAEVIKAFSIEFDFKNAYVALGAGPTGGEFADALSASAIAAKNEAPVILTGQILSNSTKDLAKEKLYPTTNITVLGGIKNVSAQTVNEIRVKGEIIKTQGELENKNIDGNLAIAAKNSELKNSNIKGNLYIENDNVLLSDVKVDGTIYINPGSKNTCKLENVDANKIIVLSGREEGINLINTKAEKLDVLNKDNTRIIIEQNTKISETRALASTTLQVEDGCFGEVTIPKTFNEKTVKFIGNFEKPVKVEGQAYLKALSDACIKTVEIKSDKNDEVVLDGEFNDVYVYTAANIKTKEGTSAIITAKNSEAKSNANIYVPENTDVKVRDFNENNISGDGKNDALSESTSGGGGGGGSSSGGSDSSKTYDPLKTILQDRITLYNNTKSKYKNVNWPEVEYTSANKTISVVIDKNKETHKLSDTFNNRKGSLTANRLEKIATALEDIKINGIDLPKYVASKDIFKNYYNNGDIDYSQISKKLQNKDVTFESIVEKLVQEVDNKGTAKVPVIKIEGLTVTKISNGDITVELNDETTYKELKDAFDKVFKKDYSHITYGNLAGEYSVTLENSNGKTVTYKLNVTLK
ncbi:cell wall-binding repeat-containing protein [Clostridium cochlearium]|uniref:Cell wall-binding repeat-containing protein n=1 Tax=Clostridium cochlearium TaxID=1494 RepID=A0A7Y4DDB8_CLOCO|nr:cell wall-binding repeat-containing protein [Clostridium cochlearium]NOH16248.1 cell wall-binding repeat-containing protein [Clostridium cochlearium]